MPSPLLIAAVGLLTSALLVPLISAAHSAPSVGLVRWEYVAGIVPNGAVPGGVEGYNLPWSIREGSASVNLANGQIRFSVRGLVFGSAPVIGTTGSIDEVIGTLVCDINPADTAGFVLVDTPRVTLSPQGDAAFVGIVALDPVCVSEPHDLAFLIRIPSGFGGAGEWIAHGAARIP